MEGGGACRTKHYVAAIIGVIIAGYYIFTHWCPNWTILGQYFDHFIKQLVSTLPQLCSNNRISINNDIISLLCICILFVCFINCQSSWTAVVCIITSLCIRLCCSPILCNYDEDWGWQSRWLTGAFCSKSKYLKDRPGLSGHWWLVPIFHPSSDTRVTSIVYPFKRSCAVSLVFPPKCN